MLPVSYVKLPSAAEALASYRAMTEAEARDALACGEFGTPGMEGYRAVESALQSAAEARRELRENEALHLASEQAESARRSAVAAERAASAAERAERLAKYAAAIAATSAIVAARDDIVRVIASLL